MTFSTEAAAVLGEIGLRREDRAVGRARYGAETLHGRSALRRLSSAWNALEARRPSKSLGPTASACVADAGDNEVRTVVVRDGPQIVLIWPLSVGPFGPFTKATRLGRAIQCYDDVVLSPNAPADAVIAAAWREIVSWGDLDYVGLSEIEPGSPLLRLPPVTAKARVCDYASRIDLSQFDDAADYSASLSKNRRGALRRKLKRLSKGRSVVFRSHDDAGSRVDAVKRAMAFKRTWLDAQRVVSVAFGAGYFENAFVAIAEAPACTSDVKVFSLSVDGEIVAVEIGLIGDTTYQSHVGAFAKTSAKDGVGALLTQHVIGWCIEEGLSDYDMLAPDAPFKRDWTDKTTPVYEALVPISYTGHLAQPLARDAKRAAKAVQARLPTPMRRVAASVVQALRG